MKNGLGDLGELRQMVFEFMVDREVDKTALAKRIGISYKTLKMFLDGTSSPKFKSVAKIINFFRQQEKKYNSADLDKEGIS